MTYRKRKNPRNRCGFKDFSGAAGQIRTADLVITNDALYRLSYSSKSLSQERSVIIAQSRDLSSGDFRFFIFPRKNGAAAKCSQFLFLSFTVRTRFPPILIIKDLPNPLFLLFFFSFFKTKARSRLLRVFVCLFRVVEFKIVDADGIAVLDALLLQTVEQAAFAELAVKVHAGFVIIEVDIIQELLEPFA